MSEVCRCGKRATLHLSAYAKERVCLDCHFRAKDELIAKIKRSAEGK